MYFAVGSTHLGVGFAVKSRGRPKTAQGVPGWPMRTQSAPQREANGAQGTPKDGQWEAKITPMGAKGSPIKANEKPRRSQMEPKWLYIYVYIYIYTGCAQRITSIQSRFGFCMKNLDLTGKYQIKLVFFGENQEMIPQWVRSFCLWNFVSNIEESERFENGYDHQKQLHQATHVDWKWDFCKPFPHLVRICCCS